MAQMGPDYIEEKRKIYWVLGAPILLSEKEVSQFKTKFGVIS